MLRFVRRGNETAQPLGELPAWLSAILRSRGVDTTEKAERFLHPTLDQLHDPYLMDGMEKAVRIIRGAVAAGEKIIVYGDYDVDGVCATTILLETLRELGAQAEYRIPSRHNEGYGLNCDAVREMAQQAKLLITVDCGVTNHEEVRLAQLLGMTVIVTDHHQLADTPSPADAVLNPLIGDYPFRRLCGAGVALKLCQALCGMEGVLRRIDVAALATVADIVPLIDENRVIVRAGLEAMAYTVRPGLRALMQVSDVQPPVNSGHVGFRLAPRLNAGGRLADASQGVELLLTREQTEAERIARQLEESNQQRQAIEQDINAQAMKMIDREVDFHKDRIIIVMGEGWNSGVIGLTAGRICEKYHFPTIVLSRQDDMAVGSCRSIPGVNIHAMLTTCKDLFERFGGHEQAAGLTMRAEFLPELRRRMNLAIVENCDEACYIPVKEYDMAVPLSAVTLDMIDMTDMLQPTGYGNPSPVFLAQGVHVQEARRVGRDRSHLKMTLLDGATVRGGIGFSLGDAAEEGYELADVLFSPERNEYMGRVTPQMNIKAVRAAEGSAPVPAEDAFFRQLLQEIVHLAEKFNKIQYPAATVDTMTEAGVRKLLANGRGTLLIAHERERAALFALGGDVDVRTVQVSDKRAYNTLLIGADPSKLTDVWRHIVLLDGQLLPGEAEAIAQACPRATLHCMKPNPAFLTLLDSLRMDDETLRGLYRCLRAGHTALSELAAVAGMTQQQALTGLTAFMQVKLIELSVEPYAVRMLPPVKCRMDDSEVIRYLRALKL